MNSTTDVESGLQLWARGLLDLEAAIDFLLKCTMSRRLIPLFAERDLGTGRIWVDADAAKARVEVGGLSGGEGRIARIVLELLGVKTPVPLGDLATGIGDRDAALLMEAIAHCAGGSRLKVCIDTKEVN
jgi:hypothetical protein